MLVSSLYTLVTYDPNVSRSRYAGVVGLSTALKIQEKGHSVAIVAETFPDDPKSIRYTSHWAVSSVYASWVGARADAESRARTM